MGASLGQVRKGLDGVQFEPYRGYYKELTDQHNPFYEVGFITGESVQSEREIDSASVVDEIIFFGNPGTEDNLRKTIQTAFGSRNPRVGCRTFPRRKNFNILWWTSPAETEGAVLVSPVPAIARDRVNTALTLYKGKRDKSFMGTGYKDGFC